MTKADRCRATTVLTNLGDLGARVKLPIGGAGRMTAGNLTLDAVELIAPIRPLTQVTFSALTYASQLTLGMHYDRRVLSGEEAGDLLRMFVARLQAAGA